MGSRQHALRVGRPVWLQETGRARQRYPDLSGDRETGVVIVGGGITGALVAHAFASAGIPCVVLEGALAGRGSTAASSALLLQEPDLEFTALARRYGLRAARTIWQMSQESVSELVTLVTRLRIACDLQKRDAVYYATGAEAADRLHREWALRMRMGFAAKWLGPAALQRITGISGHGAIQTRGSAQFDPYRACLGILQAASAAGAQVFERSTAQRIVVGDDRVRVHTRRGAVTADRVVIATGYATAAFRPLAGRFRMYRTYVLGSEPLNASRRRPPGLSDVMVWNAERPYHYARWTSDHRLLLGGGDRRVRPGQRRGRMFEAATRELRAYFEEQLPALSGVETPVAWEGLFAMTPDSLPYIGPHRRYPHHWFALGYGGNGTTFSFLAARLLLERWQGRVSRDHGLFAFGRTRR